MSQIERGVQMSYSRTATGTHITCLLGGQQIRLPDWKASFVQKQIGGSNSLAIRWDEDAGIDGLVLQIDFGDIRDQPFLGEPFSSGVIPQGAVLSEVRFYSDDTLVDPPGYCAQLTVRSSRRSLLRVNLIEVS
jgi:hypothetical protein